MTFRIPFLSPYLLSHRILSEYRMCGWFEASFFYDFQRSFHSYVVSSSIVFVDEHGLFCVDFAAREVDVFLSDVVAIDIACQKLTLCRLFQHGSPPDRKEDGA